MKISFTNDRGFNCYSLYIISSPTKVVANNIITSYILQNVLTKPIYVILITLGPNTGIKHIPGFNFNNNILIFAPFIFHIKNLYSLRCQDIWFIHHFIPSCMECVKFTIRNPNSSVLYPLIFWSSTYVHLNNTCLILSE